MNAGVATRNPRHNMRARGNLHRLCNPKDSLVPLRLRRRGSADRAPTQSGCFLRKRSFVGRKRSVSAVLTLLRGSSGHGRPYVSTCRVCGHIRCLCGALRSADRRGGRPRRDIPGQQFADAVDRVVGDAAEHVAQVGFGIEPVELGRADQAVDRGGALAAGVGAGKEVVLPSQRDGTQGPLGGVIVCVLLRRTVLPGASPGRLTLVPAGST